MASTATTHVSHPENRMFTSRRRPRSWPPVPIDGLVLRAPALGVLVSYRQHD